MTNGGNKDKLNYLMKKWKFYGDKKARDELVTFNEPLVHSIIKRFKGRLEYEDLFQLGMVGLIKAIDRFDFSKNVKFSTYAVPVIIGEIKTYLRDDNPVKLSRSIKEQGAKIKETEGELAKFLNRSPSIEEIAKELDIDKEEVAAALEISKPPLSIHYDKDKNGSQKLEESLRDKNDSEFGLLELIDGLDQKEKKLIILRYVEERSQKEVGEYLGINQVNVSRWEKKILRKLREMNESAINT